MTVGGHQAELVTSERAQAGLSVAQGGGGAKLTATQNKGQRWGQTHCNMKHRVMQNACFCSLPCSKQAQGTGHV